jgi:hypothetical protein
MPAQEPEVLAVDYYALLFLLLCVGVLGVMNLVDLVRGLIFR